MSDEEFFKQTVTEDPYSHATLLAEENAYQTVYEEFKLANGPFADGIGAHPEAEARFYAVYRATHESV